MRMLAFVLSTILLVGMAGAPADAENRYGKQKVVYHINYEGGDKDKPLFPG